MLIQVEIKQTEGTIPVVVDGVEEDKPIVVLQVVVGRQDLEELDALYDPSSSTSPPAANQRPIARAILDAWRAG